MQILDKLRKKRSEQEKLIEAMEIIDSIYHEMRRKRGWVMSNDSFTVSSETAGRLYSFASGEYD